MDNDMNGEYATLSQVHTLADQADLLTFDIFDTLFTRRTLHPTDLFALVEARAQKEMGLSIAFRQLRVNAEHNAYRVVGGGLATLDDIYLELEKTARLTRAQADRLKAIELEEEAENAYPRLDMRALLQAYLAAGKKIALISDMYLPSDEIRKLLSICGYPDNLELWVSCERNGIKADGSLWRAFFAAHPDENTLHIGDNAHSDCHVLTEMGRKALLIPNPAEMLQASPLYPNLRPFDNGTPGNSLVLGTLVNCLYLNAAFGGNLPLKDAASAWLGPVLGCFFHWLVDQADDSLLLFVTREGYLFQPIYQRYCEARKVPEQPSCLYFASRQAVASASLRSESDLNALVQQPFTGTLGAFARSRLNYDELSEQDAAVQVDLPRMKSRVLEILAPYQADILSRSAAAAEIYREYTAEIRSVAPGKPLTIVDIGYQGTAQFYLSRLLNEKVAGRYIFLNEYVLPRQLDCPCDSLALTVDGMHPVYENLLFLEAAIQVPYGQLLYLARDGKGGFLPVCNHAAQTAPEVSTAQEGFSDFVTLEGRWAERYGAAFRPSLALAEEIYISLIRFDRLPPDLLRAFRIDDAYSGNGMWVYEPSTHTWRSNDVKVPLSFLEGGRLNRLKFQMKNYVKKHAPSALYEPLRVFWTKFIK